MGKRGSLTYSFVHDGFEASELIVLWGVLLVELLIVLLVMLWGVF